MSNPQCFQCGGECEQRIAPPHTYKMKYDGGTYQVLVDNMPEWYCRDCDVSVIDEESDPFLQAALRKYIGLLSPEQIRAGLKKLKLSQEKFAEQLGCAAETVSRWLNGAVLQSRTYDRFMRVYFLCPEVRGRLENFSPDAPFGETVVLPAEAAPSRSGAAEFIASQSSRFSGRPESCRQTRQAWWRKLTAAAQATRAICATRAGRRSRRRSP